MAIHGDPALDALMLPFADGELVRAPGAVFLRARAGASLAADEWPGLDCEAPFRPDAEALARAGFTVACTIAAVGAAIAFAGLETGSFVVFTLGCTLIGVYMSAQGFYRFAAADVAPAALQPRMISLVQAGGLASALIGPQLAKATADGVREPQNRRVEIVLR